MDRSSSPWRPRQKEKLKRSGAKLFNEMGMCQRKISRLDPNGLTQIVKASCAMTV